MLIKAWDDIDKTWWIICRYCIDDFTKIQRKRRKELKHNGGKI